MNRFNILLAVLGVFMLCDASAQQALPAAAGEGSGIGGHVSFTVGQLVYYTYAGSSGSIAEGVQQPYEISLVSAVEPASGVHLYLAAYPNPVSDKLILEMDAGLIASSEATFLLLDATGKTLDSGTANGTHTRIDMQGHSPGTYFLRVTQGKRVLQTFKILKP